MKNYVYLLYILFPHSVLLRMRNFVGGGNVVKKIKTHILRSVTFSPENRAVYEIMWKNMAEKKRPEMTI